MTPPVWFELSGWWCHLLRQKRLKKEWPGGKGVNQEFHFGLFMFEVPLSHIMSSVQLEI